MVQPDVSADAGSDQSVFLPSSSITLQGIGAALNGQAVTYQWSYVNGASGAGISDAQTASPTLTGLIEGLYTVQLVVTNSELMTAMDEAVISVQAPSSGAVTISGELKKWHKVTLAFDGPQSSETASPNPFTDFRLNITFNHAVSGKTYSVPGYFAADGDAANSSATSGNIWKIITTSTPPPCRSGKRAN